MLLVIWWYAAKGHRLIDKTMERFEIMFFAFRPLLVPIIFILSIAIILFRNNIVIYFWLLVIVVEVIDLVYRRNRPDRMRKIHFRERPMCEKECVLGVYPCWYILGVERTLSKLMIECITRRSAARVDGQLTEDRMDMHIDGMVA
jgi:hypothetical protein